MVRKRHETVECGKGRMERVKEGSIVRGREKEMQRRDRYGKRRVGNGWKGKRKCKRFRVD